MARMRNVMLGLTAVLVASTAPPLGSGAGDFALAVRSAGAQSASKAWLGLELATRKDGKSGVHVRHVVRSSPSDTAGMKDGDEVLSLDAKPVKTPGEVIGEVRAHKPGDVIDIAFERGGTERKAKVKLETFPGADEILKRDKMGTFAPALGGLTAVQGAVPASLRAARGKVVVLDFWASWCVVCRMVAPVLNGWHDKLGAQGLVVVGVSSDAADVATKAATEFGIKYPVAVDKDASIFPAYGVSALPTLFVIDKRGVVRAIDVGFDGAELQRTEALLATLLAEKPPED